MYQYKATETFWRAFYALQPESKESVRAKWAIFKKDPFDPSLGTHKIHKLSAREKTNVYSVPIEADLRVVFIIKDSTVITIDVGTHSIYKG